MHRRSFLKLAACGLGLVAPSFARAQVAAPPLLVESILRLRGPKDLPSSARLLLPQRRDPAKPLALLVLLHGLGETVSEAAGLIAWSERYGLVRAFERLARPPVTRTLPRRPYLSDSYLLALNRALEERPFGGMAILCPVTPNVYRQPSTRVALDRYAEWIASSLLPTVAETASLNLTRATTAIDGCSLGGYIALEVFLRTPERFGSVGMVQGAIGVGMVERYASALQAVGQREGEPAIRLGTSTQDPYRKANEALAQALRARSIAVTLEVPPGPHDQPFLREIGTLAMLDWHDRVFADRARTLKDTTGRSALGPVLEPQPTLAHGQVPRLRGL